MRLATIYLPLPRYSGGEGRGEGDFAFAKTAPSPPTPLPRVQGRGEAPRGGFTLIEMLVVIAIILILAGMMMAVSPGVSTRQQAYRGAGQLQGALSYVKNRAKMNMLPTGILLAGPSMPWANNVQFIQSGGDYAFGLAYGQGMQVNLTVRMPAGAVNSGDFLEMAGGGLPHYIQAAGGNTLLLGSSLPVPFTQPVSYRIMRSPRVLVGEEPVQMPNNVAIDLTMSGAAPNQQSPWIPLPGTFPGSSLPEVLFSPSGALTGPSSGYDIICFMVRDISLPYPQGFPTIIAVYGKTGFITAHPANTNPNVGGGNPFWFALNPRSSGL